LGWEEDMQLRSLAIGAASLVGALTLAGTASADIYFLNLTEAQSALPAPYGQVEVTQGGAGALNFTVTLFDGLKFVDTGAHFAFTFSLDGAPAISLTSAPAGFTLTSGAGTIANAPFTGFDFGLNCGDPACGAGGSSSFTGPLNFTVSGTGLTLSMLGTADTFNGNVVRFAADTIAVGGATGTIGGGVPGIVPEPATWAMLILGFGMVGAGMRMRRRSAAGALA
jgi:hypothetical protein